MHAAGAGSGVDYAGPAGVLRAAAAAMQEAQALQSMPA